MKKNGNINTVQLRKLQTTDILNCAIYCHLRSPVSWSEVTAAVNPTPDDPRPVVGIALGAVHSTYLNSCDFATLGSPMRRTLISLQYNKNYAISSWKNMLKYNFEVYHTITLNKILPNR